MATHNLEDLLDEIDEDAVIEILEDTNELGALLKCVSGNYIDLGMNDRHVQTLLAALTLKARKIREDLVRLKYPLVDNNPNQ